jgi:hypothetical protein
MFQFIFDSYSTDYIIHFNLFWNQTSYHVWYDALTRMYIRDLDIYLIITSDISIHFWFILYRLYHPFQFILESDFIPCMVRCSNSYRKYFSILYIWKDQRFKHPWWLNLVILFLIFIREKKSLRWTDNVWTPRKMLSRMLRRHTLVRMKKRTR